MPLFSLFFFFLGYGWGTHLHFLWVLDSERHTCAYSAYDFTFKTEVRHTIIPLNLLTITNFMHLIKCIWVMFGRAGILLPGNFLLSASCQIWVPHNCLSATYPCFFFCTPHINTITWEIWCAPQSTQSVGKFGFCSGLNAYILQFFFLDL